jgi:hypothetical protein
MFRFGIDAPVEQVDAPFRNAGQLGHRDRKVVAHEADRLGVEVAAGQDLVVEDERIVRNAVRRGAEHLAGVGERLLHGAEDLRHATHCVRVLHALAVLVTAPDLAVGEQ